MQKLIAQLKKELNKKEIPGKLLNSIMDKKLKDLAQRYEHDDTALWVGSYIADLFIVEARTQTGNHMKHVPMAADFAKDLFKKETFTKQQQEIILELIETHHGGKQKFIESKLFKNADCFKFLEPEGVFHLFGVYYKRTNENFKETIQNVMFKVDEKYKLIDLDDRLRKEAKELYDRWQFFFDRMGYELVIPELYQK